MTKNGLEEIIVRSFSISQSHGTYPKTVGEEFS